MRPSSVQTAIAMFQNGEIGHVQISAPSPWRLDSFSKLQNVIPTCIHSTFLNVIGENNWRNLESAARVLNRFQPVAIIEHFGILRDSEGQKHGVHFGPKFEVERQIEIASKNIKKWRTLFDCPIYVENIPVSTNSNYYLDAFANFVKISGVKAAVDIPHLIISESSSRLAEYKALLQRLREINPSQVHISGLSISTDRIEDSHRLISTWLMRVVQDSGIRPDFVTIEQSALTSQRYLARKLQEIRCFEWEDIPDLNRNRMTRSEVEFSRDLANERAKGFGLASASRKNPTSSIGTLTNSLKLFEENYPFMNPIQSLIEESPRLEMGSAVEVLSSILSCSADFTTWYGLRAPGRTIFKITRKDQDMIIDFGSERSLKRLPKSAIKQIEVRTKDQSCIELYSC